MQRRERMKRKDFIIELRKEMSGHFSPEEIENTAAYYEDYIDMQLKKGRSEEEILRELGEPRLLAKSMRAASGYGARGKRGDRTESAGSASENSHLVRLPKWLVRIVVVLVLIAIIRLVYILVAAALPAFVFLVFAAAIYHFFIKN